VTALSVIGLSKLFANVRAVDDLSVEVAEGEMLVLVGPSGCGKTTCLRCLAGLERPSAGRVSIGERVVTDAESDVFVLPEQRRIGMVFQSYAVWPHMTVRENVAFPLRAGGVPRTEIGDRVDAALRLVRLEGLGDRYSSQLSGGQQQRVALARSLVFEPRLLLFDEPLSNLDANLRLQMRLEIKELQRRLRFTAVYVTHDQTEAMAIADRIAIMNKGVLAQLGTPREIYDRPASAFVAGFMGTTNLLSGTVTSLSGGEALVEVSGGFRLAGRHGEPVQVGQAVQVSIRPEDARVSSLGGPVGAAPNRWEGRVGLATFLGESIVYRIDAGPNRLEIHARPTEDFAVGADVAIDIDAARCRILSK
jgi:iron(III) transport system ATP-binding protein